MPIGGRIRKARVGCKLTTRELAAEVGVSQNYLSVVERNDKQASPALLQKIAEFTGVSFTWLKNGKSVVEEAAKFSDARLLLTLIMQQNPTVTKETVAAVLAVNLETVDEILSGTVEYDPQWESGLSNLTQRMDLPVVRKKIQALDALLQLEEDKKVGIELFWTLRKFLSKKFKCPFRFAGQPVKIREDPEYTRFTLQREDETETWDIRYYPAPLDDDIAKDILSQVEDIAENGYAAVAFSDEESYCIALNRYATIVDTRIGNEDAELSANLAVNPRSCPDIYFILVDDEAKTIKEMKKCGRSTQDPDSTPY